MLWFPVLLLLVISLFKVYRMESQRRGYKSAPLSKGLLAIIYLGLAANSCMNGIGFVSDGYYMGASWFVMVVLFGVGAVHAFRSCMRDLASNDRSGRFQQLIK